MEQNKEIYVEQNRIFDETEQSVLLNCMSDLFLREILFSTVDEPMSVLQISKENNIPLRTTYRKVQYLLDSRLLKVSGAISDSGKKFFLYKSRIRSISTRIDNSNVLYVYAVRNSSY